MLRGLIVLALAVGLASPAFPQQTAAPITAAAELPADQVIVVTDQGEHRFTVEIADDPVERSRGLMFRETLAADHGMLFDFGMEGERSFWMRNTPLPLDIIYIRADGTVVSIAKDTTPFSEVPIPSNGPARFVLEVNAGISDQIGLKPGNRLRHRRVVQTGD